MQRTGNDLPAERVIERSNSLWLSAVALVKKKNGVLCFCVNYRTLSDVTVKDSYALLRTYYALDALVGVKW